MRRILRVTAVVLAAMLAGLILSVVVLRVTNPRPHASTGWDQLLDMPKARGETASALSGDELVVAGGMDGLGSAKRDVSVYNAARNEWHEGRALPAKVHHAAAAAVGSYVYISGGARSSTNWTPLRNMYRSLPGEGWQRMPQMPEGRQGHAMVALDERLYIVGGVGETDRVLVYDTNTKQWTAGATMPDGRDHLRAVVWHDEIWALGGRIGRPLAVVDIYNPKRNEWRRGPKFPLPLSAMAVGVLGDGIHVVGGEDPAFFGGGVMNEHLVLSNPKGNWTTRPQPMLPVHGAAYGVADGQLFVIGGASRGGAMSILSWTDVVQAYSTLPTRVAAP